MKTTIDIADDLIERARIVQKRDGVTLRSLVEEGLRQVLAELEQPRAPYRFEPVIAGEPWMPGMPQMDVNALIAQSHEDRADLIFSQMQAEQFERVAAPVRKRA